LGISQHEIAEHVITTALSRSECLLARGASASVARQPVISLASHSAAELEPRLFAGANDWFEARVAVRGKGVTVGRPQGSPRPVSRPDTSEAGSAKLAKVATAPVGNCRAREMGNN